MSAFEKISLHYWDHGVSLQEPLFFTLSHGYVISTPEFFFMLLPVIREALVKEYPNHKIAAATRDTADCWYLGGFAGSALQAWKALPYDLPWFAYERGRAPQNRLRLLPTSLLRKRTSNLG